MNRPFGSSRRRIQGCRFLGGFQNGFGGSCCCQSVSSFTIKRAAPVDELFVERERTLGTGTSGASHAGWSLVGAVLVQPSSAATGSPVHDTRRTSRWADATRRRHGRSVSLISSASVSTATSHRHGRQASTRRNSSSGLLCTSFWADEGWNGIFVVLRSPAGPLFVCDHCNDKWHGCFVCFLGRQVFWLSVFVWQIKCACFARWFWSWRFCDYWYFGYPSRYNQTVH